MTYGLDPNWRHIGQFDGCWVNILSCHIPTKKYTVMKNTSNLGKAKGGSFQSKKETKPIGSGCATLI